jgi:hypothetical protein
MSYVGQGTTAPGGLDLYVWDAITQKWVPASDAGPTLQDYIQIEEFESDPPESNLGWSISSGGAGAGTVKSPASVTPLHPGVREFISGASAAGSAAMHMSPGSHQFGGGTIYDWETILQVPTLSVDGVRFRVQAGFADNLDSGVLDPTNAADFFYQDDVSLTWQARTASASSASSTIVDTGVAVVAGAWVNLRVVVTSSTSVDYYINGVLVASIVTDIPTAVLGDALTHGWRILNIGASGGVDRSWLVDALRFHKVFTVSRAP